MEPLELLQSDLQHSLRRRQATTRFARRVSYGLKLLDLPCDPMTHLQLTD